MESSSDSISAKLLNQIRRANRERDETQYYEKLSYEGMVYTHMSQYSEALKYLKMNDKRTLKLLIKVHNNTMALASPYSDQELEDKLADVDEKYSKDFYNLMLGHLRALLEFWDRKGMLLTQVPTQNLFESIWGRIQMEEVRKQEAIRRLAEEEKVSPNH